MTKKQQKEFEEFLRNSLIELDKLEKGSTGNIAYRMSGRLAECKYITDKYLKIFGRSEL